jgi:hypothetical protein
MNVQIDPDQSGQRLARTSGDFDRVKGHSYNPRLPSSYCPPPVMFTWVAR